MARPGTPPILTGNLVPTSGNIHMFRAAYGVEDNTIESAVIMSFTPPISKPLNISDFDSIRTACQEGMIDDSYGTRFALPTESHHFRGYPKPQTGAAGAENYVNVLDPLDGKYLGVTVSISGAESGVCGFDITGTIQGTKQYNGGPLENVNVAWKIDKGTTGSIDYNVIQVDYADTVTWNISLITTQTHYIGPNGILFESGTMVGSAPPI